MDDATDGADEQHRHLAQLLFKSASESLSINTEKGQWRSSLPPYFQRTKPVGGWGVLHRNAGAAIRRNRKKNKKKGTSVLVTPTLFLRRPDLRNRNSAHTFFSIILI